MSQNNKPPEFEVEVESAPKPRRSWLSGLKLSGLNLSGRIGWALSPRLLLAWGVLALIAFVLLAGTPHILYKYDYLGGRRGQSKIYTWCKYFGIQGLREERPDNRQCRMMKIFPIKW